MFRIRIGICPRRRFPGLVGGVVNGRWRFTVPKFGKRFPVAGRVRCAIRAPDGTGLRARFYIIRFSDRQDAEGYPALSARVRPVLPVPQKAA
ncbi:hypothetical protein GCM10023192_63830 [Amycolatopsis samaneae]